MPAVYVGYRDGRLLYVGQTGNLRERFREWRFVFDRAKVKVCIDHDARLELERRLIRRLKPTRNSKFTGRKERRMSLRWGGR